MASATGRNAKRVREEDGCSDDDELHGGKRVVVDVEAVVGETRRVRWLSVDMGTRTMGVCLASSRVDRTDVRIERWLVFNIVEELGLADVNLRDTSENVVAEIALEGWLRRRDIFLCDPPPDVVFIEQQPRRQQSRMQTLALMLRASLSAMFAGQGHRVPVNFVAASLKLAHVEHVAQLNAGELGDALVEQAMAGIANSIAEEEGAVGGAAGGVAVATLGNRRDLRRVENVQYRTNKKTAIAEAALLLDANNADGRMREWKLMWETFPKKRDDLADCLLQGVAAAERWEPREDLRSWIDGTFVPGGRVMKDVVAERRRCLRKVLPGVVFLETAEVKKQKRRTKKEITEDLQEVVDLVV